MSTEAERFAFTDDEWREYQAMPDQGFSHRGKLEFFVNRWRDARGQVTPDRPTQEEIAEAISVELAKRTNWEDNDSAGLTTGTDIRLATAILALFNEKGNK